MKAKSFLLCALFVAVGFFAVTQSYGDEPEIKLKRLVGHTALKNPKFFKGIDTLAIGGDLGPGAVKLLNTTPSKLTPAMIDEVQRIFSDANRRFPAGWVSIKPSFPMSVEEYQQPNVMMASYTLSARQETIAGKPVKVASIALQLGVHSSQKFSAYSATYPFVVPDTQQELEQRIRDGVFYLSSALPNYFGCANKYGYQTKECPDCSLSVCNFYETWEERK